jgi:cellulose synthase/poly-beta-1,6-N-acetylglucosamine synthase-like glycosyltransferase
MSSRVAAIIPAHQEEQNIAACIKGLQAQTFSIDILISCDNCTDKTEEIARSLGARTIKTVNNTAMRSGAINQGIDAIRDNNYDYILAMDADSKCAPNMIEEGIKTLENNLRLGATCSRAGIMEPPGGLHSFKEKLLWRLQKIEYSSYDASRVECQDMIKIAHGLATMFRKEAVDQQKARKGYVYNPEALTEDYELTLDLKDLGWKVSCSMQMLAWTIPPTNFAWLWKQRSRWGLGAIDTLIWHGLNRYTFWDIFTHITSIGILFIQATLIALIAYLITSGEVIYVSSLFVIIWAATWLNGMYRLKYCQDRTKWDWLLCISMIPNELYQMFLIGAQLNAYKQYLMGEKRRY